MGASSAARMTKWLRGIVSELRCSAKQGIRSHQHAAACQAIQCFDKVQAVIFLLIVEVSVWGELKEDERARSGL